MPRQSISETIKDTRAEFEGPSGIRFKIEGISTWLLILCAAIIIFQNHGKIPGATWAKTKLKKILK